MSSHVCSKCHRIINPGDLFYSLMIKVSAGFDGVINIKGEKIDLTEEFEKVKFKKEDRFELETRLNDHYFDHGLKIGVVPGETVETPHKFEKYSRLEGLWLDAKALKQVILVNGWKGVGPLTKRWREISKMRE